MIFSSEFYAIVLILEQDTDTHAHREQDKKCSYNHKMHGKFWNKSSC